MATKKKKQKQAKKTAKKAKATPKRRIPVRTQKAKTAPKKVRSEAPVLHDDTAENIKMLGDDI